MGAAAYQRGSLRIRQHGEASRSERDREMARDLTAYGRRALDREPLGGSQGERIVARLHQPSGTWWLMNRADKGWSERGSPQRSLWAMMRRYKLAALGFSQDNYGLLLELTPDDQ